MVSSQAVAGTTLALHLVLSVCWEGPDNNTNNYNNIFGSRSFSLAGDEGRLLRTWASVDTFGEGGGQPYLEARG